MRRIEHSSVCENKASGSDVNNASELRLGNDMIFAFGAVERSEFTFLLWCEVLRLRSPALPNVLCPICVPIWCCTRC